MCGFWGGVSSSYDFSELNLEVGARILQHRGPDNSDSWCEEGVFLMHNRLAIQDLSVAGKQPMFSFCSRFVLVFNGEIYNHLAMREALKRGSEQISWNGNSDTETLLACFAAWGVEKTLSMTVGMFAIALWDRRDSVLTLARDRFGEKPLYWGWNKDTLLFGSELKALKAFPGFNVELDRNAIALLLRYNYIPTPYSIYKGIEKLRPGYYVQIKKGEARTNVNPTPFWSFNEVVEASISQPFKGSELDGINELEVKLASAVRGQMLADVPIGAFLSGGVDSSAVVALMQKQASAPVKTFAIGFNESGYNEAEYAKEVARHLGTEHTELYVDSADALALVPQLSDVYCEPFADSSQLPTFLVSRMAKQHVTVSLSGDGGDELFGGYNPYQFAPKLWSKLRLLPLPLRSAAVSLFSGVTTPDKVSKLLSVFSVKDQYQLYQFLVSHWNDSESVVIGSQNSAVLLSSSSEWPDTNSFAEWMMAMDAGQYMTDDILVKVDRAAMANSLETRVPLLDHRVFEFAWQIPQNMKIRDGIGKWILREVLYRHVPKSMIERPKKGFSIPLAEWLRGPLREWAEELLSEKRLEVEGYFFPAPVRNAWLAHIARKADNSRKLWSILMFQSWLENQ